MGSPPPEPPEPPETAPAPLPRRTPRGTRSLKVKLGALGLMLVPFVASLYAYDVERNVRVARKVRESCANVDGLFERPELRAIAHLMLEQDADAVLADLRASFRANCAALEDRLTWWRVNIGVTMSMPSDPARSARLARALDRAAVRCPRVVQSAFGDFFRSLQVPPERARAAVDEMCAIVRSTPRLVGAPRVERGVWDWGDDYVRLAGVADRFRRHELGIGLRPGQGPTPAPAAPP